MKADMSTLMALSEKADNDVRACLNTIQVSSIRRSRVEYVLYIISFLGLLLPTVSRSESSRAVTRFG